VLHAVYLLRTIGKATHRIEDTRTLVARGIYRYIRHPMYCSLLCLAWGIALKAWTLLSIALVLVATLFLIGTAWAEERENIDKFGPEYDAYRKTTRMFIPFLF
jgi:protein-S-isoprenylcysteine O-methyltransferase Ste14